MSFSKRLDGKPLGCLKRKNQESAFSSNSQIEVVRRFGKKQKKQRIIKNNNHIFIGITLRGFSSHAITADIQPTYQWA